jgi:outer membrane protein OmpA-like peptidoglycan-associated protein
VPFIDRGRRVGRSQAASIFWGLVSVFFAAAACYYFWKDHEHETTANVLRDQVLTLQEQRETLNSQKDKLQSNISETETDLKTREDFLQEKEEKLALEESQLDALGQQKDSQTAQGQAQAAVVKRFNDAVRKLVKDDETDVVVRGGRPVLRVPSSVFFAFGEAGLKPEGKALLSQLVQALNGQIDNFELRIETFTDSDGENPAVTEVSLNPKLDASAVPKTGEDHLSWKLSGERAGALAEYIREQTPLPFQNVLVVPRADFQPIVPTGTESHARNRRVEITITPLPPFFHGADLNPSVHAKTGDHAGVKTAVKPKAHEDSPAKPMKEDSGSQP